MNSKIKTLSVAAALAASLGLAGCAADSGSTGGSTMPMNHSSGPASSMMPDASAGHNPADIAFSQMLIPHHAQAVQMARLADEHAQDKRVRTLAERIGAGQAPEIQTMAAWLKQRDMEVPRAGEAPGKYDHSKHGHNAMMGMLTPAEMRRLAAARGTEFDRLFLRGMIHHHRGAVAMSQQAARDSVDVIVGEMTADVNATQTAEIDRMRDLLAQL